MTGAPPGDIASGPPFVYVEPSDRGSGVLGLAVAVVWNEEARADLYDIRVHRDGSGVDIYACGSSPAKAVGGDTHVQTRCGMDAWLVGSAVFYCTRPAGHAGPHGHWPEEHRERGYPAGDDAEA